MTDGGLPPEAHSDDLTLMEIAVDAMVATDPACLPVAELLDRACRLQRLSARLDAVRAATLAAADTASEAPGVLRKLGFRNASQVVAADHRGHRHGRFTPPPAPGTGSTSSRSSLRPLPPGC